MTIVHVKKARKEKLDANGKVLVEVGQEYWTVKSGRFDKGTIFTKPPTRHEVRRFMSEFNANIDEYNERLEALQEQYDEDDKDQLISDIEEFRDQKQESLGNMPEHLQESSVLNTQIEELESILSEVEDIEPEEDEEDEE
jgi:chromosome segregation ATPase